MDNAEKQGIVDGALVFFGSLGAGAVGTSVGWLPPGTGAGESAVVAAAIAGAIAGLNSYRRYSSAAPSSPAPP